MRVALILLVALLGFASASLSESNVFTGFRPIVKFCDSHCNEACGRIQVQAQSDFRMKCENSCKWACDHRRNGHLKPQVMSDAKFFKKAFKKIKGVVKKVTSVVKKVIAAPTAILTKVVSKLPLPAGIKKVLSVVAPIALGFVTGGAGVLSGIKSIGFVGKAINAVKATKAFQVGMKVVNTVKKVKDTIGKVKGIVNTVKGIAKGDWKQIGGLAGQIGGLGGSFGKIGGKIGEIQNKVTGAIKNSGVYKAYQNIKGKVMDIKNKVTGKINGVIGKVVNFKNNALGKLDRFGAVGGFIKGQIDNKINEVAAGIKGKIQDKIAGLKEKILQKTGIAKIRDRLNGVNPAENQEAPVEEGPVPAEAAPVEEAPVNGEPQESENPGAEPQSDRFRGQKNGARAGRGRGRKPRKQIQPEAAVEQIAASAETESDFKFLKNLLKKAGGLLKNVGKAALNSAKEGAMGYIQNAISA